MNFTCQIYTRNQVVKAGLSALLLQHLGIISRDSNNEVEEMLFSNLDKILIIFDLDSYTCKEVISEIRALLREGREFSFVCFYSRLSPADSYALSKAGSRGFFTYDQSIDQIISGLKAIINGEVVINPDVMLSLLRNNDPANGHLSTAEFELLRNLCQGMTNEEIARETGKSENAVKSSVARLLKKFGVRNRTELVIKAFRENLVQE